MSFEVQGDAQGHPGDARARTDVVASWGVRFGTANTSGIRALRAIGDDLYMTGEFDGTFDVGGGPHPTSGEDDAPIARLAASGSHRYSGVIAGGPGEDHGAALAFLADGTLGACGYFGLDTTVAGTLHTSAGGSDAWVARVDPDGTTSRGWRYGAGASDRCLALGAIGDDLVVVLETLSGSGLDLGGGPLPAKGGYDVVVARFGPDGTHRWSRRFGGPGDDRAAAMAVDAGGDLYVVGTSDGGIDFGGGVLAAIVPPAGFVVRLDGLGAHAWSMLVESDAGVRLRDIASTGDQLIVVGTSFGSIDVGGGVLAPGALAFALGTDRAHRWSRTFGTNMQAIAAAADGRGRAIIAGEYAVERELTLADGSSVLLPHVDLDDVFVLVVDADGEIAGAVAATGSGNDGVRSVTAAGDRVYLGGLFGGELATGAVRLDAAAAMEGYVIALDTVP